MARLKGWWDESWNVLGGCKPVSPGCKNCYAARWAGSAMHYGRTPLYAGTTKFVRGRPVYNGQLRVLPSHHPIWSWPLRWRGAEHPLLGDDAPSLIFAIVTSDLFNAEWPRPIVDRVVTTLSASRHIGQLLTKRPERLAAYFSEPQHQAVQLRRQKHLWLGFSAETQQWFNERWNHMRVLAEAGWTVFVSVAPMLGPVVLPADFLQFGSRMWVIVSGEEDFKPRWMDPEWARALRDQCAQAGVPFFLLGMSGREDIPPDLFVRQFPRGAYVNKNARPPQARGGRAPNGESNV